MKFLPKLVLCIACGAPWMGLTQSHAAQPTPKNPSPTTQAPGTPEGGPLGTRSTETVDRAKAAKKARKAKSGKPKETAPGDVVPAPAQGTSATPK